MGRRAKPAKVNAEAKRPLARKSPKDDGAKVRDLEKRLSEALEREVEAREQQAATAEILTVIGRSPTDVQPVFETIVASAVRLLRGYTGLLTRIADDSIHLSALTSTDPDGEAKVRATFPRPLAAADGYATAIRDHTPLNISDAPTDPRWPEDWRLTASLRGYRSAVVVPLLRGGDVLGALAVSRREPGGFADEEIALLKTFADQAVIAIENVRLFTETKEALEQQTATAEILTVISSSPTDVQPVFDTIVASASQLCDAVYSVLATFDGELVDVVAAHNWTPAAWEAARRILPAPPSRALASGRAILERAVVHVPDVDLDPEYSNLELRRTVGFRSLLVVPMIREGEPLGTILVGRANPGAFSDSQIALLRTFADQAVIAIENVRLFTELEARNRDLAESLQQQTATAEILKVISRSPTDIQPVLDAVAMNAAVVCGATDAIIMRTEGPEMRRVAHFGPIPLVMPAVRPLTEQTSIVRAILECRPIHLHDISAPEALREFPDNPGASGVPWRTTLYAPLVREGKAIGAISIRRTEVRPFTDRQIALLQTFADQAVIAIENVRLFKELETRNRDLTQALEQQTATSEILRVISNSPTAVGPVFEAIVTSGRRLCQAYQCLLVGFDGEMLTWLASDNFSPAREEALRSIFPYRPTRGGTTGRVVLDRAVVHIPDVLDDPDHAHKDVSIRAGARAQLAVPMFRENEVIGALHVARPEPGPFSQPQIDLLKTFADQAVIAIENVRLFTELQQQNEALTQAHAQVTEALEQQTATAEILRVMSRSAKDVRPVFDTIMRSAVQLCGAHYGSVCRFDGELVHVEAHHSGHDGDREMIRQWARTFPRRLGESGAWYSVITSGRVVRLDDVGPDEPTFTPAAREMTRALQIRSAVFVPMARENQIIGAIGLLHRERDAFSEAHAELLKTFADQAVIAIENARLLSELQARTAELSRSVDELTALGDVSRALSSTLDLETVLQTIVTRAVRIAGTAGCNIWEYDEARAEFRLRASHYADQADAALLQAPGRVTAIPRGQGVTSRVIERREPVQIPDITFEGSYESPIRRPLIEVGHRALLGVPLLSEDEVIGVLAVTRKTPGEFEPEVVRLLSTFATQSALAIQNARLFLEIEDKSRQLEAASQHKSEFLASMSHELRTPLNAIIGFSDVLLQGMFGETNEKQTEYLQDILGSGQHLLSLINDILDLSKIEAGRMDLDLADFHLPSAIDDALLLMRERAGRRGLTLDKHVDGRLSEVHADQRKIKQVLLNLLSNAVKFTPEGGRIDVRAAPVDGTVEISVTDTGVGIAAEDHEAVFEEFRQVGKADKKAEGTGLGLALCRKFVELHGGRIWVKSQVGTGSTFTFTIPVRSEPTGGGSAPTLI